MLATTGTSTTVLQPLVHTKLMKSMQAPENPQFFLYLVVIKADCAFLLAIHPGILQLPHHHRYLIYYGQWDALVQSHWVSL